MRKTKQQAFNHRRNPSPNCCSGQRKHTHAQSCTFQKQQQNCVHLKIASLLVITLTLIVHCPTPGTGAHAGQSVVEKSTKKEFQPNITPLKDLPQPVLEMRDAILTAVQTGNIEDLQTALEWNELSPDLGFEQTEDPIAQWKTKSKSGHAYEILAILADLLAGPPARLPIGRDLENNDVFVWPFVSELDPKKLTPAQNVLLYRITPSKFADEFHQTGTWNWYRLAIGADGTWHMFARQEAALTTKNEPASATNKEDKSTP